MDQQQPSVGRIVHFFPTADDREARSNGNNGPVPAIVTRDWGGGTVNLTLFPDYSAPIARTSVQQRVTSEHTGCWDWPARV